MQHKPEAKEYTHAAAAAPPPPKPPYVFPGVHPFVESIAADTGRDLHQVGRTRAIWHVGQVQDLLGQLGRMDPESRKATMETVHEVRDGLALALEGVDAAIAEVSSELEIPAPKAKKR